MKKAFGCLMVICFVILAYVFFVMWRGASPLGVGTGSIGGRSSARPEAGSTPGTKPGGKDSAISQISSDPQKWKGMRVTVSGRVRGNTRYASNRNLYRLTDGKSSLLVVDDKTPPEELAQRSVKGIVKVVKPPVGEGYAYIVSAKGDPKIELSWKDAQGFFSDEFQKIKKNVNAATS
jgi:hypothetical protein